MGKLLYKYASETTSITETNGDSCFINYIEKDIEAYRWVFQDINHPNNFLPLGKDPQNSSVRKKCGGWALSFHESEDASKDSWQYLIDDKPNKYKKIGTHMAKGNISKSDGKCSSADEHLHFELAEYENVDLKIKFKVIKQLVSDEILQSLNI